MDRGRIMPGMRGWSIGRLSHDTLTIAVMAAVLVAFCGYIAYAERQRAARRSPPSEYMPPVHPVSLAGAQLKGDRKARVAVIVHSDFICPACGRFAIETLPKIEERYIAGGQVLLAMRHAPVGKIHSLAMKAAEAAHCAGEQERYWDMYRSIFSAQLDREYGRTEAAMFDNDIRAFATQIGLDTKAFESCLASDAAAARVYSDAGSALALAIEATPSVLVGAIQPDGRVKVSRHFRGRPEEGALFGTIDGLLSRAHPPVQAAR